MYRFMTLATAALLAASPVLADTVTIETARGATEAPASPEAVVVFDISALDTLDALGIVPVGVPNMTYMPYLDDAAAAAEVVGTLFEPDFETVNALAPDLVVIGGRSAEQLDALSRLAPTIDMTVSGDDLMAQAQARLAAYGTIFDREAEAEELATGLAAKLDAAREAVAGQGTALIVMTNGPKVSAYGAGSRFGWLHRELGLPEAVENVDSATHGEAISFEFIRDADPDWLIVVDRAAAIGAEGERAAQTLDNALVRETTAWREGQVINVNSAAAYVAGGGVQALNLILDQIIEGFNSASGA